MQISQRKRNKNVYKLANIDNVLMVGGLYIAFYYFTLLSVSLHFNESTQKRIRVTLFNWNIYLGRVQRIIGKNRDRKIFLAVTEFNML